MTTGRYDRGHVGRGELTVDPFDPARTIGTLFGHRVWRVDDEGWLTGHFFKAKWGPGETTARCLQTRSRRRSPGLGYPPMFNAGVVNAAYDYTEMIPRISPEHEPVECPGVARGDHGCGFYVRTGERYHDGGGYPVVRGVAECWGDVEFGDKGFRATKARIVALVEPRMTSAARMDVRLRRHALKILEREIESMMQRDLDEGEMRHLQAHESSAETARQIIDRVTKAVVMWPQVRKRYPDVPVFKTEAQMLESWPPTDLTALLNGESA